MAAQTLKDLPQAPIDSSKYKALMLGLGAVVPLLVAILYYFPGAFRIEGANVGFLPPTIAVINSLTAVALLAGFYFIRQGQVLRHRAMMTVAFGLGALFLLCYVAYHSQAEQTKFPADSSLRPVYLGLLVSHIVLAATTVALVLFTMYFAVTNQFARHRRIARWTFPIWLYVSVTGVILYFMIAPYYPAG